MKVFLDLEMNLVGKQYPDICRICNTEVIEFGAVKIDDEYDTVDTFQCFVKPQFNERIVQRITTLTGIKDADVAGAECFSDVLESFEAWCGTDYEVYSWSMTDLMQLESEVEQKGLKVTEKLSYMFSHWNDLQQQYGEQLGITRLTSLDSAIRVAGVERKGKAHTALSDAMATADIYREMQIGSLRVVADSLNEAKEPIGTSLGDLLNFNLA